MKLILIMCVAVSVVCAEKATIRVTAETLVKYLPNINKCIAETNPPDDAFQKMSKAIIEDEATLKFAFCYLTDTGHLDKDGRFIPSTFMHYFDTEKTKENVKNTLEECMKLKADSPLEFLRLEIACFKENSPINVEF